MIRFDVKCIQKIILLSKEIVEYLFSLPEEIRFYNNELKGAMKKAFKYEIPEEILHREKKGFSIPLQTWRDQLMENPQNSRRFVLDEIFHIS